MLLLGRPANRATLQVTGRVWRGSAFGGVKGRTEIPGIVEGMFCTPPVFSRAL